MLSICLIVKNEEAVLERCLKSIAGLGYEIVIVDTGSTDRTKEIAAKYTDKIYDFEWVNDFSAARNYSFQVASNEYIFRMDADEIMDQFPKKEVEKLIKKNPDKIGQGIVINCYKRDNTPYEFKEITKRIFAKSQYVYEGSIHEQLVAIDGHRAETYPVPVRLIHTGYDGDRDFRKEKTERNIRMLKEAMKEKGKDPYILYQLGKGYYMREEYEESLVYFEQALEMDLDEKLLYVQDMVESYGYALLQAEKYDAALSVLNLYDTFSHSSDFVFLCGLILMNTGHFQEAVQQFEKAAGMNNANMIGINGPMSYYNIGVIYECLGDMETAGKYYKKCGDYEKAKERKQLCFRSHCDR